MIDIHGDGLSGGSESLRGFGAAMDARFASLASGSTVDLIRRYRAGVGSIDRRVFELDELQLGRTFEAGATVVDADGVEMPVGRWSVRSLLGHLADADLVLTMRMRRVLAEESPVLLNWDENAFLDSALYSGVTAGGYDASGSVNGSGGWRPQAIGGHVAVVHTLRQWMGEWLGQMPMSAWNRRGLHELNGPMTLADLVVYATWHIEHHSAYLRAKVLLLLGPESEASSCESAKMVGGCGPGCGCVVTTDPNEGKGTA